MKLFILFFTLLISDVAFSNSSQFFKSEFNDREGCFLLINAKTGEVVDKFNYMRCEKRFALHLTARLRV